MMMKNIMVLAIVATLFNCTTKEVILPQLPYDGRVSIQGIVEPDSIPRVYFNRTVPYLTGSINTADLVIRNAIVKISTMGESDILKLDSIYDKVDCRYLYFYKGNVKAKMNMSYILEINDGLKTYTATATTSIVPVTIDSVSYTATFKDLYGEHEGVLTYFKDILNETNYYRYEMLRSVDSTVRRGEKKLYGSCLGGESINYRELGRSVYSDQNLEGQQIKLVIEPAFSHTAGLVGYVRVQAIDKATYEFYDQIDRQKLGQYNPFVEPFFLKEGQFGKDAIGFFGARVKSEPVKFIFPE
jgi:hypothetical protein